MRKLRTAFFITFLLVLPVFGTLVLISPQSQSEEKETNGENTPAIVDQLVKNVDNIPEESNNDIDDPQRNFPIAENPNIYDYPLANIHFEYPEYELLTTGLIKISIEMSNDLESGRLNVWNLDDNMDLYEIVAVVDTIPSNEFYLELERDLYQIEIIFDTNQISGPIYLLPGKEESVSFVFNTITFDVYDFNLDETFIETISILDHNSIPIWGPEEINENKNVQLTVKSGIYTLVREFGLEQTIDATADVVYPFRVEEHKPISGLQLNQGASFGELSINSITRDDMPLQGMFSKWYNASDYGQTGSGSSNSTGFTTFSLAPGVYDVQTYVALTGLSIWNYSVVVTGGFDNVIQVGFSHLQIYTIGNEYISIYNGSDASFIGSVWSGGDEIGDIFVPGNMNYTISISSIFSYNHLVGWKDRLVIGTRVNHGPTFTSVNSSGRVNANETTTVYIRARDLDYDYPLQFYVSQNVGTVSITPGHWVADETWGIEVDFTAPITDEFYQLDIGVQDIDGVFSNYTLYLSNRKSDVTLRNVVADFQPVNLYSGLYSVRPDINYIGWSGSDGNNTFLTTSGVLDGLYRIQWYADNGFTTNIIKIDSTIGTYFFQYNWTQITFNTTAEWGVPVGLQIYVYNATDNLSTSFVTKSTSTTTGLVTATLSPNSNYSIEARGSNSIWKNEINVSGGVLYQLNYSFAGIAVYTVGQVNRYVRLYNGTTMTSINNAWSGGDGIMLYRVSTYTNYTVYVEGDNTWITNISVVVGSAVAVGAFVNTAPTISLLNTNPGNAKINANQNVTMVVTAMDIDPVDFLSYTWSANVGTFIGSGTTVLYIAPSVDREYKIEVLVEDQFGGNDTAYMYVSNRYSTVSIANSKSDGTFNQYVTLRRNRDSSNIAAGWTGTDGSITFSSIPDEEYTVSSTLAGKGFSEFLFANGSTYNFDFRFGDFVFNTTAGNSDGFNTVVRIRDNVTNVQYGTANTDSVTGLSALTGVAPGTYNLEAAAHNSVWQYQVTIGENERVDVEFKFAEILVNNTHAYGRPFNGYSTLRNYSSTVANSWSGGDGKQSFYVNPSGNYSVEISQDNLYRIDNILVTDNELFLVDFSFAVLVAYSNDGLNPISQTVYVHNATTDVQILSRGTGAAGYYLFNLRPGIYDVRIGASEWYYDLELLPSERDNVGVQLNTAPVIERITSSPTRLNPNEQATVTVEIDDIDYDYPSLILTVTSNVGSISNLMAFHGFTATNTFLITFDYTAPTTLQLYQLNITASDGVDKDSQMYFLSNSVNTVNLHSNKGIDKPENTGVYIFDYQTGVQVYYVATSTSGFISTPVLDGWYNIEFREVNSIWFRNIFISSNQILNLTASFGEVTVFASGVGGVPINAYTTVRNATDLSTIVNNWPGGDGEISFILAPGNYQIEVVQATSVFFNIQIVGGSEILVGSEIPSLTTRPNDIIYIFGDTGYTIDWGFTDGNPHKYNLTKDGVTIDSGIWDGSPISVNVDGLQIGDHVFRLFVNDTYGYFNFDEVIVTVTSTINPPDVSHPPDETYTVEHDVITISWDINGTHADSFVIHKNGLLFSQGTWFHGGTLTLSDGPLGPGTYTYVLTVNNTVGMITQDTVVITVSDVTLPYIVGSGNQTVLETNGFTVTWILSGGYPSHYEIYKDHSLVSSGNWTDAGTVSLTEPPQSIGIYNYTIVVYDSFGGSFANTVLITSQLVPLTFVSIPVDLVIGPNSDLSQIEWELSGTAPATYQILVDGISKISSSVPGTLFITFNFNVYITQPGTYEIVVNIDQGILGVISDTLFITIIDPAEVSGSSDSPFMTPFSLIMIFALIGIIYRSQTKVRRIEL